MLVQFFHLESSFFLCEKNNTMVAISIAECSEYNALYILHTLLAQHLTP